MMTGYMVKKFDEYVNELWSKGVHRSKTGETRREDVLHPENKKELMDMIMDQLKIQGPDADLNNIDTSLITDMSYLFKIINIEINVGNIDISKWDVSNVKDMCHMFRDCVRFNSDLSKWDVSNVKDMSYMFGFCSKFNSDLSGWDVSKLENASGMFRDCENFRSDLSGWNIPEYCDMDYMFYKCGMKKPKWWHN